MSFGINGESHAAAESYETATSPRVALPTHEAIAARAYEIYAASGYVQGQCEQNWMQAERELLSQSVGQVAQAQMDDVPAEDMELKPAATRRPLSLVKPEYESAEAIA